MKTAILLIAAIAGFLVLSGCGVKKSSDPRDPDFRRDRALALGDHRNSASLEELARMCLEDPDALVRGQAAASLGRHQRASATPFLLRALEDSSARVRREAVVALAENGDRDAIPALLRILGRSRGADAESAQVRLAAATALGAFGDAGTVPGLISALEDPDPAVRHASHLALQKITGHDYAADPEEWRRVR
ncbi:MAG: HEAT repeat domain-containing protein [Planctomycetes bacterium]|nr:HEAT repeat domain-containing protein [Planctomycetota bacterium]